MTDDELELVALKAGCKRPRVHKGPEGDQRVEFGCSAGLVTVIVDPNATPQQVSHLLAAHVKG